MTTTQDRLERLAGTYARIAIGAAFLSAVASRFGLWAGEPGMGHFPGFIRYTGEVNAFMPRAVIPALAWAATAAETSLGLALVTGVAVRWTALGAAALLALFGTAMAISLGLKEPLDYSVFSASAGALLLGMHEWRVPRTARAVSWVGRLWGWLPRLSRVRDVAAGVIGLY
jgi:putative oxidoreductase